MSVHLFCLVALVGWVRLRKEVSDYAYHHPESQAAQLWAGGLNWLQWGLLLWVTFAYLESIVPGAMVGSSHIEIPLLGNHVLPPD